MGRESRTVVVPNPEPSAAVLNAQNALGGKTRSLL
jgi:hypothetical protein